MRRELASSQPFMHAGHSCGSAVRGAFAAQVRCINAAHLFVTQRTYTLARRRSAELTVASRSRSFAGLRSGVRCLPGASCVQPACTHVQAEGKTRYTLLRHRRHPHHHYQHQCLSFRAGAVQLRLQCGRASCALVDLTRRGEHARCLSRTYPCAGPIYLHCDHCNPCPRDGAFV